MVNHHRDEHGILKYFATAAAWAALALLAACGPVIPQHYLRESEAAQQSMAQRMGQESEVQRLTRLGRYDEAQRIARDIEEQDQAIAQRCAETWRQMDEIDLLQKQGRDREVAQIVRNRWWSNVECNARPRRPERHEQIVESARRVQFDAVGTREPLYVVPHELFSPESSILDQAAFGSLPEAAWWLLLQTQSAEEAGNMRETESMLARALALVQQTPGPNDRAVSYVMMRQSWAAEQQNRLPEALRYIESAIALLEQSQGKNAKMLSPLLQRHAELLIRNGDLQQGLAAGERAYALHANASPLSLEHAIALNNMGVVFHHLGDMQRTLDAYRKSQDTLRRIRETATPQDRAMIDWEMPSMLSNMGLAQWQSGNFSQAAQYFAQAQEAMLERENLEVAETEAGALQRTNELAVELDALLSLERARQLSGGQGDALALPLLLERKGAVLERQKRDIQVVRQGASRDIPSSPFEAQLAKLTRALGIRGAAPPTLTPTPTRSEYQDLLAENEAVRARRAALALHQPATPQEAAAQSEAAKALNTQIKAMELAMAERRTMGEQLAMRLPEDDAIQKASKEGRLDAYFEQQQSAQRELARKRRRALLGEIQARIPANTVLLEMVRYRPLDPRAGLAEAQRWGPPRYGAYVIQATGEPRYIDYGEAQAIDQLISAFRKSLSRPRESDHAALGRRLDAILLQPVREHIGALSQVLIAPEGMLNLLPFSALVDERNRYLVETHRFNYLTSGRDLLQAETKAQSGTAPLIFADPAFDGDGSAEAAAYVAQGERSRDFSGIKFSRLPGSGAEALLIKQVLPDATLLTGSRATETALKQARGPRILHIATHGFFLEDLNASSEAATNKMAHIAENPMLRSGLAFAGANILRSASDDGVLTALEAAALDLNGTKLVVLSACETGVGEIKNGEGVFGLRRAFLVAGAETVVMSLWPVADEATKDVMTNYYRRLTQGAGRAEALRQAQLDLRTDPKRSHPFYWASFISAGQSGSIK